MEQSSSDSTAGASPRAWSVVAAGALMTCVAVGVLFALAVFLQPMSIATGWSRAGISSAMTLAFLSMGVAGFGWGALSDRTGPRIVVLIGTALLGLANVLASRAGSLLEFQLLYGVLMGVAAGSFFAPVIASTAALFDRHRSLAVALVSAGVGAWVLLFPACFLLPAASISAGGPLRMPGRAAQRALRLQTA